MLMTGHRLLDLARDYRFAVPPFNISDWATGVDSLAAAIGTCHSIYPRG